MTITPRKKLFVLAAAITLFGVVQPGILSAQSSGVGSDGYTRFMWNETNGAISIWRIDPSLGSAISHVYGPYDGYLPVALTVGSNNYTYVMWRNTNGSISLWLVDPSLNFVNYHVYGPYAGWIPESMSISENGTNTLRIIWRETQGSVSVWSVDASLNFLTNAVFGPYIGWEPTAASAAIKKSGAIAEAKRVSDAASDANAAAAMATTTVSNPIPQ